MYRDLVLATQAEIIHMSPHDCGHHANDDVNSTKASSYLRQDDCRQSRVGLKSRKQYAQCINAPSTQDLRLPDHIGQLNRSQQFPVSVLLDEDHPPVMSERRGQGDRSIPERSLQGSLGLKVWGKLLLQLSYSLICAPNHMYLYWPKIHDLCIITGMALKQ